MNGGPSILANWSREKAAFVLEAYRDLNKSLGVWVDIASSAKGNKINALDKF